jgi:hypothetical protein
MKSRLSETSAIDSKKAIRQELRQLKTRRDPVSPIHVTARVAISWGDSWMKIQTQDEQNCILA